MQSEEAQEAVVKRRAAEANQSTAPKAEQAQKSSKHHRGAASKPSYHRKNENRTRLWKKVTNAEHV